MGRENSGRKPITLDEFIARSNEFHKGKYDYSKANLDNGTLSKIQIICPEHGIFIQQAASHLRHGCKKCGKKQGDLKLKSTLEEFISRSKVIHGNKYDYSKVKYVDCGTKVELICPQHNSFLQRPMDHLAGCACKKCSLRSTAEKFIAKANKIHKNKYDYSKVIYVTAFVKVDIICRKCGSIFSQVPNSHLGGGGCPKCGHDAIRDTQEDFLQKAKIVHGDLYDYSQVVYKKARIKVEIRCKHGHVFHQLPVNHLYGSGCPSCYHKNETEVGEILRELFVGWNIKRGKMIWKTYGNYKHKRFCDYWLEKDGVKIICEFDGHQHFAPVRLGGMSQKRANAKFRRQKKIHVLDAQFCKENNIILHRIKYNEDKRASVEALKKMVELLK